jgi:LemA protein
MAVWILIGLLAVAAVLAFSSFRGLAALQQRVERAWEDLDGHLRQRCDLVPRMVDAGQSSGLPDLLPEVAAARRAALEARSIPDRYEAEERLTEAVRRLFPLVAAGGTLASVEQELTAAEQGITAARQAYNEQVMALNVRRHRFPWRLLAVRFPPGEYFIIDDPGHR